MPSLPQHRAGARRRGIPFLLVRSLRARELLLALKPLLLERRLLSSYVLRSDPYTPTLLEDSSEDGSARNSSSSSGSGSRTSESRGGTSSSGTGRRACAAPTVITLQRCDDAQAECDASCENGVRAGRQDCTSAPGHAHGIWREVLVPPPPAELETLQLQVLSGSLPLNALLESCRRFEELA